MAVSSVMGSAGLLEAGEFGVRGEPGVPAADEGVALALAGEDTVEVPAGDAEFLGGESGSGVADQAALGLMRGGGHFSEIAFWRGWRCVCVCRGY